MEHTIETSAALAARYTSTPARGWVVALLSRLQTSSVALTSFTLGMFLPFIRDDLQLSSLQAGLFQGVSWLIVALMALPAGLWFARCRPVRLILVSLVCSAPLLFLQGLAWHFGLFLGARCALVLVHEMATPACPLLLQQWVAPRHYALVNAVGMSQHSLLLGVAISTSTS